MRIKLSNITRKNHSLLLAYDQGLEHGPTDFNDQNVDPSYVLDIAEKGGFTGVILQKGVAEKYYHHKVPLVLKLNGKTNLLKGEPLSTQLCSVKQAVKLGAKAVGYTIYVGSAHEQVMFKEFHKIQSEAHDNELPVIAWMYPRGKAVKNPRSKKMLAYAARIGLELGADFVKLYYPGSIESFKWVVKCAGKARVLVAGGEKKGDKALLKRVNNIINAGGAGMAIGRNIWQHKEPLKITKALKKIVFDNKSVSEALRCL
ncbi:hypothetical protein GF352_02240 [archaeon]|nr:hypothetical protein [archaeon]